MSIEDEHLEVKSEDSEDSEDSGRTVIEYKGVNCCCFFMLASLLFFYTLAGAEMLSYPGRRHAEGFWNEKSQVTVPNA